MSDAFTQMSLGFSDEAPKSGSAWTDLSLEIDTVAAEKKAARQANVDAFGRNNPLSDTEYAIINRQVSLSPTPVADAYKWSMASHYARYFGKDLGEVFKHIESYHAAYMDIEPKKLERDDFRIMQDYWDMGVTQLARNKEIRKWMDSGETDTEAYEKILSYGARLEEYNKYVTEDDSKFAWLAGHALQAIPMMAEPILKYGAASASILGGAILFMGGAAATGTGLGAIPGAWGMSGGVGLFASGVGAFATFAESSNQIAAEEYFRQRQAGVSSDTARFTAGMSGLVQGYVETALGGLVKSGGMKLGNALIKSTSNAAGARLYFGNAMGKFAESIANLKPIQKLLSEGAEGGAKKIIATGASAFVSHIGGAFEEGAEEAVQQGVSYVFDAVADSLSDEAKFEHRDVASMAADITEQFKMGAIVSLVLGVPGSMTDGIQTYKGLGAVRAAAYTMDSDKAYSDYARAAKPEGIEAERWDAVAAKVRENAKADHDAEIAKAADIADDVDIGDLETTEEGEIANPEAAGVKNIKRLKAGGLYVQASADVEPHADGSYTQTVKVGDPETGERYGYAKIRFDGENATVESVKMKRGAESLRGEFVAEVESRFDGKNFTYKDKVAEESVKSFHNPEPDTLTKPANTSGPLSSAMTKSRRLYTTRLAKDIRTKMPKLSRHQSNAAALMLDRFARYTGKSIEAFVQDTFGQDMPDIRTVAAVGKFEGKKGAANWEAAGDKLKAVIYATEHGDFSTFVHEMGHIMRKQLKADDLAQLEAAIGVKGGRWIADVIDRGDHFEVEGKRYDFGDNRDAAYGAARAAAARAEEHFARALEAYHLNGEVPHEGLRGVFERISRFMREVYAAMQEGGIAIDPRIRKVIDRMYTEDNEVRAGDEKTMGEKTFAEVRRKKRAENSQIDNEDAMTDADQQRRDEAAKAYYEQQHATPLDDLTFEQMRKRYLENGLTGIPNKQAFIEDNAAEIKRTGKPFQNVASMDADSLKWVNDNFGHNAGNTFLNAIADALRRLATSMPGIKVYHFSGDEYTYIADDPAQLEMAQDYLEHVFEAHDFVYDIPGDTEGRKAKILGIRAAIGQAVDGDLEKADRYATLEKEYRTEEGSRAKRGDTPVNVEIIQTDGSKISYEAGAREFFDARTKEAEARAKEDIQNSLTNPPADPYHPANIRRRRAAQKGIKADEKSILRDSTTPDDIPLLAGTGAQDDLSPSDLRQIAAAKDLEGAGASQDDIAARTGWKKNPVDGKYRKQADVPHPDQESADLAKKATPETFDDDPDFPLYQAAPAIDSEAFKAWFGDSKVVDSAGKPLVVYHGSPDARGLLAEEGKFATLRERLGMKEPNALYFFTNSRKVAASYADDHRAFDYQNAEPATVPVYLSLKNPLMIDAGGKKWGGPMGQESIVAQARADGHDGIIIQNTIDTYDVTGTTKADVYVAFAPEQIKRPENKGTWAKDDARILYQGRDVDNVVFKFTSDVKGYTDFHSQGQLPASMNVFGRGVISRDGKDIRLGAIGTSHVGLAAGLQDAKRFYFGYSKQHRTAFVVSKNGMDDAFLRKPEVLKAILSDVFNKYKLSVTAGRKLAFLDSLPENMLYQEMERASTETKAFKTWFKKSAIVDEDGSPLKVYHGTTFAIEAFDKKKTSVESNMGAGFYFTSDFSDANRNYAGIGPDLELKISRLAEDYESRIDSDPEAFGLDPNDYDAERTARDLAENELAGDDPQVLETYLSIQNPAIIGGEKETVLTFEEDYDEETDEYDDPTGTLLAFLDEVKSLANEYGGKGDEAIAGIYEEASGNGGITVREAIDLLQKSEGLMYTESYDEAEAGPVGYALMASEIIRRALEAAGFDGIIDNTVSKKFSAMTSIGETHYIAFRPTQIKDIYNRGSWDTEDPRILFQGSDEEISAEARSFASWQEWRDFAEAMDSSGKPDDATADKDIWYRERWLAATTERKYVNSDEADAAFAAAMKTKNDLDAFLSGLGTAIKYRPHDGPADAEDQAMMDRLMKAGVDAQRLATPTIIANAQRVKAGKEITDRARKHIETSIAKNPREYRALYAQIMDRNEFAAENDTTGIVTLPDITEPSTKDWDRLSIEQRYQIGQDIADEKVKRAILSGDEKVLNGEGEALIRHLDARIKTLKADIEEKGTALADLKHDYSVDERKIIDLYAELSDAKALESRLAAKVEKLIAEGKIVKAKLQAQLLESKRHARALSDELAQYEKWAAKDKARSVIEARAAAQKELRGIMQERAAVKKMRQYKRDLSASIMKKTSNDCDWQYAAAIAAVQDQIDPNYRRPRPSWTTDKDGAKRSGSDLAAVIAEYPWMQQWIPKDYLERVDKKNLDELTVADLEEMAELVGVLRKEGRAILMAKRLVLRESAIKKQGIIVHAIKQAGKNVTMPQRETVEDKQERASLINKLRGVSYTLLNTARKAMLLDGYKEGLAYDLLVKQANYARNQRDNMVDARRAVRDAAIKVNGKTVFDLYKKVSVEGLSDTGPLHYTVADLMYVYLADQNVDSRAAVMFGNMMSNAEREAVLLAQDPAAKEAARGLYEATASRRYAALKAAADAIDPAYKRIADAIQEDWDANFDRMDRVSKEEFNRPVSRVEGKYVSMQRQDMLGGELRDQLRSDLLNEYGVGQKIPDKGPTISRVAIAPEHQTPLRLDLVTVHDRNVQAVEHFISYSPYVRELNRVFNGSTSGRVREAITAGYGQTMMKHIDEAIQEHVNPASFRQNAANGEKVIRLLRGNLGVSYLGMKMSSVVKQFVTSPSPFFAYVSPVEYAAAALKILGDKGMYGKIMDASASMRNRSMSPIVEMIEEAARSVTDPKAIRAWHKVQKHLMDGLTFADRACVAPGWLAVYNKELHKTGDEMLAAAKADEVLALCQPSGRAEDLAPLFKEGHGSMGEAMKLVTQFLTPMSVIYQQLTFDLPMAIKNREAGKAFGILFAYIVSGIGLGMLAGYDWEDNDDDEEKARKFAFYAFSQFTDAAPLVGDVVSGLAFQAITGEKRWQYGDELFPAIEEMAKAGSSAMDGKWDRAASQFGKGLGYSVGFPVSGVQEAAAVLMGDTARLIGRRTK